MELFDYLSEEDKTTLNEFIISYSHCNPKSLETVLDSWNKNKRKMFKALGKQLRVKIPIHLFLDNQLYFRKITEIYKQPSFELLGCNSNDENNSFITDLYKYVCEHKAFTGRQTKVNLTNLFLYSSIEKKVVSKDLEFIRWTDEKKLIIPKNMKIIKAIQKVLIFIGYDRMDLFEDWRNALSNLSVQKEIKANLVFSIHPIDFLTMSDNNCGWQSCMSWMKDQKYSAGVIEMLNSNMVIMCYLESEKDFMFNYHQLPNKSWRCLFYVHKNIILSGKPYPYNNKQTIFKALEELQKLLEKNLKWKYQYKMQEYRDIIHYRDNFYLRDNIDLSSKSMKVNCLGESRHSILLYSYIMYNDLIEDHDTKYWCCRNYVDRTLKISVSARATCMCCGSYIDSDYVWKNSSERNTSEKYCKKCETERYCNCCNQINSHEDHYMVETLFKENGCPKEDIICGNCISEYFFDTANGYFICERNLLNFRDRSNFIKAKEMKNIEQYKFSDTV